MTKGMLEAKISERVTKFEHEHMGRGPKKIKSKIVEDMVIVRLVGFLTPAEKKMACDLSGIKTIKQTRMQLFEYSIEEFKRIFEGIFDSRIISIHSDISTVSGEKIIIVVFEECIADKLGDECRV